MSYAWLGNSEIVARKHYLQVTDSDFNRRWDKKRSDRAPFGVLQRHMA
jgi:hypothetical protein